ncbi:MAG: bactoprenol glucosyl transferase [Clostridiales bacterium GWF2_38_85]|nr:MAG: bactoprenol glucosyl transferase [Clostridiales bacterium GWF2_38_85]HBL85227.1 glycosyltransferase [Clostridiales bacterium]
MNKKELISIVVPCYNEYETIPFFYTEIIKIAEQMNYVDFEFIFVNDGSKDNTIALLKELAIKDERARFISFSRNFGKEPAMFAGLQTSKGDYVAIMDADLQDPPALLPEMYNTLKTEDYDSVATRRNTRKGEPLIRSFFAKLFYKLINKISETEMIEGARDFRLMNRKMTDAVLSLQEYNRFTKGIFCWVGYKTKWLEYKNIERVAGKTKFNFWKLFKYSLECIIAFSTAPLVLASFLGIFFTFIAFISIIALIVRELVWHVSAAGWPSTMVVILLLGGIQIFSIGVLGQYLSKTYLETKKRPIYLVRETEKDIKKEEQNQKEERFE